MGSSLARRSLLPRVPRITHPPLKRELRLLRDRNHQVNFSHMPHFTPPVQQAAAPGGRASTPSFGSSSRCSRGQNDTGGGGGGGVSIEEQWNTAQSAPSDRRGGNLGRDDTNLGDSPDAAPPCPTAARGRCLGSLCWRLLSPKSAAAPSARQASVDQPESKKQSVRPISDVHRFFRCHRHRRRRRR